MPVPTLAFVILWLVCEAILLVFARGEAYIGLGAFAYGALLWGIVRVCIRYDANSEATALKTTARGWRLYARAAVVCAALVSLPFQTPWLMLPIWKGDSALPNFIAHALVPGLLLFALGAKPLELGLSAWRKGSWAALAGACVVPFIFAILWFMRGHGSGTLLAFLVVHNFLSNGFSEEFLIRGMTMSHLRAFITKDWALAIQAVLFGLLHLGGTIGEQHGNWSVATADVIALNAPMGYFLGLIALRSRGVLLPGLIHTTLDTLRDIVM